MNDPMGALDTGVGDEKGGDVAQRDLNDCNHNGDGDNGEYDDDAMGEENGKMIKEDEEREKVKRLEEQLGVALEENKALDDKVKKLCEAIKLSEKASQVQDLLHQNSSLRQQVDTLRDMLTITNAPSPDTSGALQEAQDRIKELEGVCKRAKAYETEVDGLKAELKRQSEDLEKQNEKLKATSRRRAQAQSQLAAAQASVAEKTSVLQVLEEEKERARSELESYRSELGALKKKCELAEKRAEENELALTVLKGEHEDCSSTIERLEEEIKQVKSMNVNLEEEKEASNVQVFDLQKKLEEVGVENRVASKKSAHLIRDLRLELSKFKDCESDFQVALSEANARAAKNVDDAKDAQAQVCELRKRCDELKSELQDEKEKVNLGSLLRVSLSKRPDVSKRQDRVGAVANPRTNPVEHSINVDMAKRLEDLLVANQHLKEKAKFLEANMHSYIEENAALKKRKS